MFEYFERIHYILKEIEHSEKQNISQVIKLLTTTIKKKQAIFIFGASHAGILTEEMFYRAGGLVTINPIFGKELMLDVQPITKTSQMERLSDYGSILAQNTPFKEDDVLIIHSVSGRNPVSIDLALSAKNIGVKIIVLTNLKYSKSTKSRHLSGKHLFEVADIIIDNHGDIGDGAVSLPKLDQRVGPSSTVIGASILNHIVVEVTRQLIEEGNINPPIFYSANLDGGNEKNKLIFQTYKKSIHYKL